MEELARPQRLPDAVDEGESGHRLVGDLGIDADHLRALERRDEVQRVADRRQEDVAAGLVRLRLDREPQLVALFDGVVGEDVDRLPVALERVARVLRDADLRALATAPEDVDLGAEFGAEVDRAHRLADRRAPHPPVVRRERAVLEGRVAEQVGRRHADAHAASRRARALNRDDDLVARGRARSPRDQIVVVQRHAPGPEFRQVVDALDRVQLRAGRLPEWVAPRVADGPQAEREAMRDLAGSGGVGGGGGLDGHRRFSSGVVGRWAPLIAGYKAR